MNRISLDGGRWFDADAAREFTESRYHDGRNWISRATCSQWDHEVLYRTAGGAWILHAWSQWQGSGSGESYRVIDDIDAAHWLSVADEWKAIEEYGLGQFLTEV